MNHRNRTASFNIHRIVEERFTIVGMQYNEYKDSYKSLTSQHTYYLLRFDNNGKLPEFRPDEDNSFDDRAVYIGMPHNKYGFIAKKSNYNESSSKFRELLYTKEYKDGKITAIVKDMNTDNVFRRKNESVTATGIFYINHPLCDIKSAYGLNSKNDTNKIVTKGRINFSNNYDSELANLLKW